jgi:hypothetical protein
MLNAAMHEPRLGTLRRRKDTGAGGADDRGRTSILEER